MTQLHVSVTGTRCDSNAKCFRPHHFVFFEQALLDQGANVDLINSTGRTALGLAQQDSVINMLRNAGIERTPSSKLLEVYRL